MIVDNDQFFTHLSTTMRIVFVSLIRIIFKRISPASLMLNLTASTLKALTRIICLVSFFFDAICGRYVLPLTPLFKIPEHDKKIELLYYIGTRHYRAGIFRYR